MHASYSAVAGGNIAPCRFLLMSESSGEPVVTQATANAVIYGISPKSTRRMALSGWDDGFAAIAGETMAVFGPGDDEALLEISEAVTAGQLLQATTDGVGAVASSNNDNVGAVALEGGASGDYIKVKPVIFTYGV